MAGKFEAYKADGTLLFDTDYICYGLVKSAYLQLIERWPQKYLRSAQLPPGDDSSWAEDAVPGEPMFGITVSGAMSPIVFIVGDGARCGEVVSGSSRTILYVGATASTKAYVFDLMRDSGPVTGFKCFRQADGALTFNSAQPPLNIIAAVGAPPLNPGFDTPQFPAQRGTPYSGGSNSYPEPLLSTDYPQIKGYGFVPVASGELAACLTFSRSCGAVYGYNVGYPGTGGRNFVFGAQEGAGGAIGGVSFMFCRTAATTRTLFANQGSFWFDIPTDRNPVALVIQATTYPFPFG